MHIPGHEYMSTPVSIGSFILSAGALGLAARSLYSRINKAQVLKIGLLTVYIILLQTIDVPVGGGTSAHLLGAIMAAAIIGPMAASIVVAFSLLIQALLFGHGSVFSLGANVLNMAIIATWAGWAAYMALCFKGRFARPLALFIGSWISVIAAASACSLELALSNVIPIGVALPAMIEAHAMTGIGDGVVAVMAYVIATRFSPKLFSPQAQNP